MQVPFDIALFRQLFAEFADPVAYPDGVLNVRWSEATSYVSDDDYGDLPAAKRAYALQCMTAHMMRLAKNVALAAAGGTTAAGVVIGATIDKVQVQIAAPPARGEWGYWLAQTPYGQQLAALLRTQAVGGFYAGGLPERQGFRKVGGVF